MESGYRLVFSGRSIYNEIDVTTSEDLVGIGTIAGCKARFSRDIFKQDFLLTITKTRAGWHLSCEVGVFFRNGSENVSAIDIQQGDYVSLCSCLSNEELFKITCLTNYDDAPTSFDTRLDLRGKQQIVIGNSISSDLRLLDLGDAEESIKLENSGSYLRLTVNKTSLGVYVNGNRAVGITRIKNHDFIACGPYTFYFNDAKLYIANSERIGTNGLSFEKVVESETALEYPRFNRNTRVKQVLPSEPIAILDPPEIPQKPTDSLVMTLLPAIAMLVLTIVFRGIFSSSTGTYVILSVCTMALGIVTSIVNYRKARTNYQDSLKERENTYAAYISRKREEIVSARKKEAEILLSNYPNATETLSRVSSFSGSLFDRTLFDADFLHIRVGLGKRKAHRKIAYKPKETLALGDELQTTPERISAEYKNLDCAPIVVDLKEAGILGVVGSEENANSFLKTIVEDLCSRQYADDAMMFAVCTKDQAEQNAWMRFIPHFQKGSGLARNIACDKESCDVQFEFLFKTLAIRETASKNSVFSAIIVFVLDEMGLYTHPVSKYLDKAKSLGVYFVFLVQHQEELPLYCGQLVKLHDKSNATLIDTEDQTNSTDFDYEALSDEAMWKMALKLAPVYCEDVSVEGNLPKSFSLFALLGIQGADDLDLDSRWKKADITKTMAAPLGLKAGDEVIVLDLHEKHHGPHGLVAGTTGSGKSEILQTYILSMATLYSPDEVGFVIIDFKGGGMANLFADLPHLLGAITDIDGKAINRSLMSIRAEIDKRKRLFAEAEVNNIGDYIRKYKAKQLDKLPPLPHLILIIDEFAELKADQPEFMKEVISAARVGRSLGVHLILATQKPAGVIDDQIWSNSRFKLCLKVQNKSDSNEVLKSPLAAEIREPGRAYFQVGNNEIFELFQSAYSGGPAQSEEMDHIKPFSLFEVDDCGRRKLVYEQKTAKTVNESGHEVKPITQLQAITSKISQYCDESGIKRLPSICLPPLPAILPYPTLLPEVGQGTFTEVGIYDDPSSQYQGVISLDLEENNVIAIGSTQYGKTNLLMTMVRTLASRYSPSEVNMYIIDFGPSIISNCKYLPHVGGVVTDKEDEKLKNLFKMLFTEMDVRREKLLQANVSSFKSYKEAGHTDMPMIVLFVDNFTALKELYLTEEDYLMPICRNGLSVGISVVMANSHTQGIGYRYLSNFSKRIALYCNDSGEYSTVIERCRTRPDDVVGRGIIELDKKIYEFQTYCSFSGDTELQRVESMNQFIHQIETRSQGQRAKRIPEIPNKLSEKDFRATFGAARKDTYRVPIGVDYASLAPVQIDLLQIGAFATVGAETMESKSFIQMIVNQLQSNLFSTPAQMYLVDNARRSLKAYQDLGIAEAYTIDPSEFVEYVDEIHSTLRKRFEMVNEGGIEALDDEPLLFVVVDNSDAINALCKNATTLGKYKEILDKFSTLKVCFLYMNVENLAVNSYSGPEVLKRLKESRAIFFFDSLKKLKFVDITEKQQRTFKKERVCGDGYYFAEGELAKLKVVTETE